MLRGRQYLALAFPLVLASLGGCFSSEWDSADYQPVLPADFGRLPPPTNDGAVSPTSVAKTTTPTTTAPAGAGDASTPGGPPAGAGGAPSQPADPTDLAIERALSRMRKVEVTAGGAPAGPDTFVVDAMVGQVNGQAIFCSGVFEPLNEQLAALGRTLPRSIYQIRAKDLIKRRLEEIVTDSLLLGEAERDLSEQEIEGVRRYITEERAELLRRWGNGSEFVANQTLMERTGKTLDQSVQDRRNVVVVQRYMRAKFYPKINVTRKDIERYYADHQKEFNPPPKRKVRIIRVTGEAAADVVDKELASGAAFAEVASRKPNAYRADEGGMIPDEISSPEFFAAKELNEAMAKLSVKQASPRVKVGTSYWWLYVDSVSQEKGKALRDMQGEIEDLLKRQRFQMLSSRYNRKLYAEGSYNPIDQMTESLVNVAMARFAVVE